MAIKLYGSLQSTCTQRVILVCNELGTEYDFVEKSMQKGEHKDPEYVKSHHPFGRLPAIEDNGLRLFESRAICRYLVSKSNATSSSLDCDRGDTHSVGQFEQAASVEYSYFDSSMTTLAYEMMFKRFMGRGDPDTAIVDRTRSVLRECLDYYETIFARQPYLSGESFTLIDLYHMPWIAFFSTLGMEEELSSRPGIQGWWKLVSSRPSWKGLSRSMAETGH